MCTHLYDICVLCKSPVLCGVVPRLYTQVRAKVTTSRGEIFRWFAERRLYLHLSQHFLVVRPVLKIKTGFRGFETEQNPGF